MSKDVDCEADKVHRFQQKSNEEVEEEEEEEEDKDNDDQNIKLLAMEQLVPISQSLITPSLAKLFNLNLLPHQQPFLEGIRPAERSQNGAALISNEELQLMQLQEGFHASRAEEEDSRLSADDPCLQIMMDPFADPSTSDAAVGYKRSHLDAGLEGFNMQLGDGINDHAEGFGMNHLIERENSSNSGEGGAGSGGGGGGGGGSARTLKRPRLVWTPQLHKRFVDAVSHLGIKNAVPKTIMQLMNVDGLTRENVASHLQKYRLYLRRVHQGNLFSSCANSPNRSILGGLDHHLIGAPLSPAGSSDHLFSSSSIPSTSMTSNNHLHHHHPPGHINPLNPSHMQSLLMQQPQHQLNQAISMIKSPPLHFNPHRFIPNAVDSNSPTQRSSWPSPHSSLLDINPLRHMESHGSKGPPSPPRQALTLFPH